MQNKVCIALLICLLAGCAHIPRQELRNRAGEGGGFVTVFSKYGPFHIIRTESILPGEESVSDFSYVRRISFGETAVSVQAPQGMNVSPDFISNYAKAISEIPEAIAFVTGVPVKVREIRVLLVPPGSKFENRSSSLALRSLKVEYALRAYSNSDVTIADSVRTVSHELFHAVVALFGKERTGYRNELAAVTVENCVELAILGTTSGAMPGDVWRGVAGRRTADEARLDQAGPLGASEQARYGADTELEKLFQAGPITRNDWERADSLYELCKNRSSSVVNGEFDNNFND